MMWVLLLLVWIQNATGSVYTVVPADVHLYDNTTCHHCHKLQHYLLNITKYFTSNTQLLFQPGLHHLHTDLIIHNVHNISLIGGTTNGTIRDTAIQCNSSVGIVMTNITNLIVTNIAVRNCLGNKAAVLINLCTDVQLRHVVIEESHNFYGIVGINIFYITSNALNVIYNETLVDMENHSLSINHYHNNDINNTFFQSKIMLKLMQQTYRVNVQLSHSIFQGLTCATAINMTFKNDGLQQNYIAIKHCWFFNSYGKLINIEVMEGHKRQHVGLSDIVHIDNCKFFNNRQLDQCSEIMLARIIYIIVTGFSKRGLPPTSISMNLEAHSSVFKEGTNLQFSTSINLRWYSLLFKFQGNDFFQSEVTYE